MKILLTCPPMIGLKQKFQDNFKALDWDVFVPDFNQTMSEEELMNLLPSFEGWIIGDDPATERVVSAGAKGNLRAAVKWGGHRQCRLRGFRKISNPRNKHTRHVWAGSR